MFFLPEIENKIKAYFSFDEASGNAIDSIENVRGTISNIARENSENGKAVVFNGTNSSIALSSRIMPIGAKTIRFKIKTTQTSMGAIYTDSSGSATNGTAILINNGYISFQSNKGGSPQRWSLNSKIKVNDGQWHDVILTWDGTTSSNTVKIIVDNFYASRTTALTTETAQATNVGTFGAWSSFIFRGVLDEFEVYNAYYPKKNNGYFFEVNSTAYTIANGIVQEIGTITAANAATLFTNGLETITKDDCILIGQQLGKAKIIKMDV